MRTNRSPSDPEPPDAGRREKGVDDHEASAVPTHRRPVVPPSVGQRFLQVGNRYHFPDRTLAFTDLGHRLTAQTHNREVLRCLVVIARARGWDAIRVKGTAEFRREVWREASLQGIEVQGYAPSELERVELERAIAQRRGTNEGARNADAPAGGVPDTRGTETRRDAPAPAAVDGTPASSHAPVDSGRLIGRLIDHGAAPYRLDPTAALSYHVTLRTPQGDRVLWGVDLERALVDSHSGVRIGDRVAIERRGAAQVTVKVPQRDAQGNLVGDQALAVRRQAWLVETPDRFAERDARAAALRRGEPIEEDAGRHDPGWANAVASLRLGEQFATARIERSEDRERFLALLRETLAQAWERGDAIDAPGRGRAAAQRRPTRTDDPVRTPQRARSRVSPRDAAPPEMNAEASHGR